MKEYEFRVDVIYPPEFRKLFFETLEKEKSKGVLGYRRRIEEAAPPPDLIKDIILLTAASLSIIKTLYEFYRIIKARNKKSKVYVTVKGKRLDMEAYDVEELKAEMANSNND